MTQFRELRLELAKKHIDAADACVHCEPAISHAAQAIAILLLEIVESKK